MANLYYENGLYTDGQGNYYSDQQGTQPVSPAPSGGGSTTPQPTDTTQQQTNPNAGKQITYNPSYSSSGGHQSEGSQRSSNVTSGAMSGAQIGTAIAPGPGTAIGAVAGAGLGAIEGTEEKSAQEELLEQELKNKKRKYELTRTPGDEALQATASSPVAARVAPRLTYYAYTGEKPNEDQIRYMRLQPRADLQLKAAKQVAGENTVAGGQDFMKRAGRVALGLGILGLAV